MKFILLSFADEEQKAKRKLCECSRPIDDWTKRLDVPQYGTATIHQPVSHFIPERLNDNRLIQVHCVVEFVGEPPKHFGIGVYRVVECLGFEHLKGKMYGIGYNRVNPREDLREKYELNRKTT